MSIHSNVVNNFRLLGLWAYVNVIEQILSVVQYVSGNDPILSVCQYATASLIKRTYVLWLYHGIILVRRCMSVVSGKWICIPLG